MGTTLGLKASFFSSDSQMVLYLNRKFGLDLLFKTAKLFCYFCDQTIESTNNCIDSFPKIHYKSIESNTNVLFV